ncbi:MAG: phosphoglucosamine mutase [archaeon]|nr:phosphoglucosamine mutase [archaeon]
MNAQSDGSMQKSIQHAQKRQLFGTDGIRGKANSHPMTPEMAVRIGKAVASIFRNGAQSAHSIVIGKDTRVSGYMLETALTSGIVSMGVDVLLVGPMPTPAIAKLTSSMNADAGIVLSASHNPAQDNGIKIFDSQGYKLSDETELEIEKLIFSKNSLENPDGKIGKAARVEEARGRYIEYAKSTIKNSPLAGLKIVLDCANGAAYYVAPKIFSELGAEVIVLNDKPDGFNINLNCGALHPEQMRNAVIEHHADFGVALDGDADRAVVVNDLGELVHGDAILALAATELKKRGKLERDCAVVTIMSNFGLLEYLKKNGINPISVQVGDRYVIEEMRQSGYNFGGEQSGHVIFSNYTTTGDGIIASLQLARLLKAEGKKLSELMAQFHFYPQTQINVPVKEKKPFNEMPAVLGAVKKAESRLLEKGRVLLRYSGTENIARVLVEGNDKKEIGVLAQDIADEIKKELG